MWLRTSRGVVQIVARDIIVRDVSKTAAQSKNQFESATVSVQHTSAKETGTMATQPRWIEHPRCPRTVQQQSAGVGTAWHRIRRGTAPIGSGGLWGVLPSPRAFLVLIRRTAPRPVCVLAGSVLVMCPCNRVGLIDPPRGGLIDPPTIGAGGLDSPPRGGLISPPRWGSINPPTMPESNHPIRPRHWGLMPSLYPRMPA